MTTLLISKMSRHAKAVSLLAAFCDHDLEVAHREEYLSFES